MRTRPSTCVVPIVLTLAASGVLVAGSNVRAVDPPPVVDSTDSVLDADAGNPDGVTTLADAVWLANTDPELDTITFDLQPDDLGPIDTTNVPTITEDLVIVGPGLERLTLTSSTGPVLTVDNDADITISDLSIDGAADGPGPFVGLLLTTFGTAGFERLALANALTGFDVNQVGPDPTGALTMNDVTVTQGGGTGISTFHVATVTLEDVDVSDSPGFPGVSVEDANEVAVTGGSVTGTLDGLDITEVGDVTLTDVESTDNAQRGVAVASGYGTTTISGAAVSGNGGVGIEVDASGAVPPVGVDALRDVSITGTTTSSNDGGISITGARDVVLTDVESTDNVQRGVAATAGYGTTTISGAAVSGNGGVGIEVDAGAAVPPPGADDVRDVSITDSTVSSNDGGGVSITGAGDLTMTRLEITDNGVAPSAGLGGVYLGPDELDPSLAVISESVVSGNSGDPGGGVTTSNHDGELTITDSTISGNQATGGKALRIASIAGDGLVQVVRSEITGHAAGAAPVVYDDGVSVRIIDSNVIGNAGSALFSAANGSGISVRNSTITGNSFADAVFQAGASSFAEALETTVTGNTPTGGSAGVFRRVLGGGQLIAENSVLSGNGGAPVAAVAGGGVSSSVAVTYSLVPTGTPAGTGNVVADEPGLGALADNGGPLPTMLPAEGSPGIDLGNPLGTQTGVTADQRGLPRIVNGRIDMGAVERQESPFVVGLPPSRILETRSGPTFETIDGEFEGIGRRADGSELTLPVAERAGVPVDAEAVVVNVTAVAPSGVGFVTIHPCLVNPPLASSLNFRFDVDSGNEIVAELDENGDLCLFVRTETDLVVDVVGYVPADSRYTPVGPARLLDTRFDAGDTIDGQFESGGIRQSDTELALDVAGRGGVSEDAVAVVVNVTAVKPVSIGYVTVHPCLPEEPTAASLNFEPGVNRGNEIVAQLDSQGRICLYTWGSAELVVDVVGQLTDENVYEPVAPARLIETRDVATGTIDGEQEKIGRLDDRETLTVRAAGRAGVPDDAESVIVNVTAIRPDLRGFITVWDCTGSMPLAASLNYITGEIVGNELVVALDGGEFCVFTNRATDLTVDVVAHLS